MKVAEDVAWINREIIAHGQQIYDQKLKEHLESTNSGRFVAIEPGSGGYFLGNTGSEAVIAANKSYA
jgi:hypothetical protein